MYADKLPPHNIDAEEAVIGSLLIDGASIHKIAAILQPADFYGERNRAVYESCVSLFRRGEAINQITVAQELAGRGKLESSGGAAYLSHLIAICPTPLDIEHYAQIVYRLSMMRELIGASSEIARIGYESGPDVEASMARAEAALFRLRRRQGTHDLTTSARCWTSTLRRCPPSRKALTLTSCPTCYRASARWTSSSAGSSAPTW